MAGEQETPNQIGINKKEEKMKKILKIALVISLGLLSIIGCGSDGSEPIEPEKNIPIFHSDDQVYIQSNEDIVIELNVTDSGNEEYLTYYLEGADERYFEVNNGTGVIYTRGNLDKKNIYKFTAVARDFVGNKGKQKITVIIDNKPIFTSDNKISVKEKQIDVGQVVVKSVSKVSYSLSGTDKNSFSISSTGFITFKKAPNYDVKSSYVFVVKAIDEQELSSSQTVIVTIIDVAEPTNDTTPPKFISASNISVQENQKNVMTVKATDVSGVTYALGGTDVSSFNLDSLTGVLTFKIEPDYETKSFYTINITATDGKNNSKSQTITITILDVKEIAQATESDYFITTWKTDNEGVSNNNQIKISTVKRYSSSYIFNYEVDWGDGKKDKGVSDDITHTYDSVGTYTIKIFGDFPGITLMGYNYTTKKYTSDAPKLLSIEQWGTIKWKRLIFHGAKNMLGNFSDVPDLSNVTSMSNMFSKCTKFNSYIGNWDVSNVTSMFAMFNVAESFNQNLSQWDVSNVTDMTAMFGMANEFNQDISHWDVSNVESMRTMFNSTKFFNQDISTWDTTSVSNMEGMFSGANEFNQDISSWNVSNVTEMSRMFASTYKFDQNLETWNVSKVLTMDEMFQGVTLSTSNYNSLLNGWSRLTLQKQIVYDGGRSKYTSSASSAREKMVNDFGWSILDGGEE